MDPHRAFLIKISQALSTSELKKLVFVFAIPRGRAEQIDTTIDFFLYLEEQTLLKPGKYDELKNAMELIERHDLVNQIDVKCRSMASSELLNGMQENASGELSNIPPSVLSERHEVQQFEKDGYGVKAVGGCNHFCSNNINLVQMKIGNRFHIELSNSNEKACFVDIHFLKHDGKKQEKYDVRVGQHENRVAVFASANEKFEFQGAASCGLLGQEFIQFTIFPEEFVIYFQTRSEQEMQFHVPQVRQITVDEVLERLNRKYPGVVNSYIYNGKKILQAQEHLSFSLNDHSEKQPLLLLKKSERITLKLKELDNTSQIKHIDIDPIKCNLETIEKEVFRLFDCDANIELKVDGKEVDEYMDCLKGTFVEVIIKRNQYRDLGFHSESMPPISTKSSLFPQPQSYRPCINVGHDDDLEELLGDLRERPQRFTDKRIAVPFEGATGASTAKREKANTSCPDINVVTITIFLVPL